MRGRAATILRAASVILVGLALSNLAFGLVTGGPFDGYLSTAVTLLLLAGLVGWVAWKWPVRGTPVTISPFWRTTLRAVGILVLLYDATNLLLLPFLGWRVVGSLVLLALVGGVLLAASFVGRRSAIDATLLPSPSGLPFPRPPMVGPSRTLQGPPVLPPVPGAVPWPGPPVPELERSRVATLQTVSAAYAQARARVVFVAKVATGVVVAPLLVVAFGAWAFGVDAAFLLALWGFLALVFGGIFLGWYVSLLLIDEQLARGVVPGPEHPLPPAVALYRWGRRSPSGSPAPLEASWDLGTAMAMIRFGRRMTRHARSAAWAILVFILFLAGPGAYLLTVASLLRYGGGIAHLARDAGIGWGVLLLVWLAGFALLYRYYRQTDGIDRKFGELERALLEIERDFWGRY